MGDFNFHMNKSDKPNVKRMMEILDMFDLIQHVTKPTHKFGNTLDLIITKRDTKLLSHKVEEMLSDHNALHMNLNIQKPPWTIKYITYRNLKNINIREIKMDSLKLNDNIVQISDTNKLVSLYNNKLMKIIDKHAPKRRIKMTVRNKTPWTTGEIFPDKTLKRKLERKWLKTKLIIDDQNYKTQRNKFNALLRDIRAKRLANEINEDKYDPRRIYQIVDNAMYLNDNKPFPPEQTGMVIVNEEFINYYHDKIKDIHSNLEEEDKSRKIFTQESPLFKTEFKNFKELK